MVKKTVLHNGIRVITENIPHAHSVTIGIWVASGSRDEVAECNGVAHFIEHLLFKGTERRNALQIAREIDALGGILNAFTGREYVCYYAKVLHRFLPKVVDLLADIFLNSLFEPEEIEKERKVILQEIGLLEDSPDDYIHDLFARNFWQGHPLGRPIIGTEQSVGALDRDVVVNYRNGIYRGENIIIAAAGKVDHDELLPLLNGLFDQVPAGKRETPVCPPPPTRKIEIVSKELEQIHLCLGTLAIPQDHPLRYEAFILNAVLGGSMSSRLFQEVREKLGLAYSIYSYTTSHSDSGSIAVYAGTSRERFREVIEIVLREFRRLKTDPLSSEELENVKEQLKGNILLSLESSDNRMTKLAKNEIYFGRYQPLMEIVKGIDQVTPESILELAGGIIDDNYLTLVLMGETAGAVIDPAGITL
ncbi:MAG TPA: pitrilysin family protein [Geobacteraceae bacterium]|nr:pitrilysin family protein [Geobacteraceae bacterium]